MGQRHLRGQQQYAFARRQAGLGQLKIYSGLAAAGHAKQQAGGCLVGLQGLQHDGQGHA